VRSQLDEALLKIEHYQKIYVEWGFGEVDPAGKSLILNFYGPPGTGKTLTAEAFSGSLGKNIMLVSIADLESKFMGDTSKTLSRSSNAKTEDAVLFSTRPIRCSANACLPLPKVSTTKSTQCVRHC